MNRHGTAWRRLDEPTRASVVDAVSAKRVLLANPSAVKRPVVEWDDGGVRSGSIGATGVGGSGPIRDAR